MARYYITGKKQRRRYWRQINNIGYASGEPSISHPSTDYPTVKVTFMISDNQKLIIEFDAGEAESLAQEMLSEVELAEVCSQMYRRKAGLIKG